jgi:hypothetical protein
MIATLLGPPRHRRELTLEPIHARAEALEIIL